MKGCILKGNHEILREGGGFSTKFVSHFVDLDLQVEIFFKKEGATEKGGIDFEIRD